MYKSPEYVKWLRFSAKFIEPCLASPRGKGTFFADSFLNWQPTLSKLCWCYWSTSDFWSGKRDHRMLVCYPESSLFFHGCFSAVHDDDTSKRWHKCVPRLSPLCCCGSLSRLIPLSSLSFCFLLYFFTSLSRKTIDYNTKYYLMDVLSPSWQTSHCHRRIEII